MTDNAAPTPVTQQVSYGELARLFLRLSVTAFGGPVAHMAIAEDEIVTRRGWLTREHFLDLIAATNLIPGPNSTEVMIHVGYTMRGIPGAVLTGACFIVPAFLVTLALAVVYASSGEIPQVDAALRGIMPAVVAIIAVVAYRLIPSALKTRALWLLFALALLAVGPLDVPEVAVMLGAGVLYAAYDWLRRGGNGAIFAVGVAALGWQPALQAALTARAGVWDIFIYFLKIGSVLFGSGYVLITYIQQDLVTSFGWLTNRELLDAIAIGQVTPGPVLTTATVVGYIIAGLPGAITATLGIFLPSFVFVILTAPLIPRMRRSKPLSVFLSGINAGVVAAILYTVIALGESALTNGDGSVSPIAVIVFAVTVVALVRFRVNATWVIVAGALVGLVFQGTW